MIVTASVLVAFLVGCLLGFGYYQLNYGTTVVSATPLEPSSPAEYPPSPPEAPGNPGQPVLEGNPDEEPPEEETPSIAPVPEAVSPRETAEEQETPDEKVAYITIDDGPHPQNTPAILAILEEFGIKATFFVLGTGVEKHPDLIKQIHEAGHVIGNHTYNHIYQETYASDESFWYSVEKTEDLIFELVGYRPTLLREPGGRFRSMPEKQQMVRDRGYGLVQWNVDSYDSRTPVPDAATIFANVKRQAQKEKLWPAMVLLFHETGGHESTVEALPVIIQYLLDEGFIFKTILEMDQDVLANLPKP